MGVHALVDQAASPIDPAHRPSHALMEFEDLAVTAALSGFLQSGSAPLLVCEAVSPAESPVCRWSSDAAVPLLQQAAADLTGRPMTALLTAADPAQSAADFLRGLLRTTRSTTAAGRVRRPNGSSVPVVVAAHPVVVATRALWVLRLGTEDLHAVRELLAAAEQRFVALAEHSPIPTMLSEEGVRLAHVNDAFAELVGTSAETLLGVGWMARVHPHDRGKVLSAVQETLLGSDRELHARLVTVSGENRRVEIRLAPIVTREHAAGFVGTVQDVTERLALQEQLYRQARHDPLTGLINRAQLWDYLLAALEKPGLVVFFLDLDNFKVINDSLGHDAGDALLIQIATRLRAATRSGDGVARFGGDEFVVACPQLANGGDAAVMAQRLLDAVTAPITVGAVEIRPSASIGVVARGPEHATPQDLLRDADIAMYQAKNAGKNQYALCDADVRDTARDELSMVSDLHAALAQGDVHIAVQPIVDLSDSSLLAVEALARWTHRERGPVSPEAFVELAERNGFVDELTRVVLDQSCAAMREWLDELRDLAPRQIHVNVSPLELAGDRLPELVAELLGRYDLEPEAVCLEITEGALMVNPDAALATLTRLHDMGVGLAIDDFGTGQSSLAYLCRLPVDCLKIDRSFVADLPDPRPRSVADAVVSLAESLGLNTIAEGVETAEQAACLAALGCPAAQGWRYARPMPPSELPGWIRAQPSGSVAP